MVLFSCRMFFCFFFFKQKTAYEMRISDWSSDVCSSDLPLLNQDLIEARLDLVSLFEGDAGLRDAVRKQLKALPDIGRALGRLAAGREIGRASCRARVCQYV